MTFRRFKKANKKVIQINQEKIRISKMGKQLFQRVLRRSHYVTCVYIETDTDFEGKSCRFLVL